MPQKQVQKFREVRAEKAAARAARPSTPPPQPSTAASSMFAGPSIGRAISLDSGDGSEVGEFTELVESSVRGAAPDAGQQHGQGQGQQREQRQGGHGEVELAEPAKVRQPGAEAGAIEGKESKQEDHDAPILNTPPKPTRTTAATPSSPLLPTLELVPPPSCPSARSPSLERVDV